MALYTDHQHLEVAISPHLELIRRARAVQAGTLAAFYHADMDPAVREATHLQWSKGALS